MIFLLITGPDWDAAGDGPIAEPGPEGFVHCCDEGQVAFVRRNYFGTERVLALGLDPTRLGAETRYEPGTGGEPERFPHLYGVVRREDVVQVRELD